MLASLTTPIAAMIAALSLLPLTACVPSAVVPEESESPSPSSPPPAVEVPALKYGVPLPESEAVEDGWFDDTAFIGHSLILGFAAYGGLEEADYYYLSGSSTRGLLSSQEVTLPGDRTGTLASGLSGQSYERVYLMMGINEVTGEISSLKADYLKFLNFVRSCVPEAEVYVLNVLPVSRIKDAGGTFTIERIRAYNDMLLELCAEQSCWYVDLYSCFADEEGFLPSSASSDGVHPNVEQYWVMRDYIKTHTARKD